MTATETGFLSSRSDDVDDLLWTLSETWTHAGEKGSASDVYRQRVVYCDGCLESVCFLEISPYFGSSSVPSDPRQIAILSVVPCQGTAI